MTRTVPAVRHRAAGRCLFAALLGMAGGVGFGDAPPARATVVQAMGLEAQCVAAERIFVATVRTVESRRNAARPRFFETLVTFAVDEVVAGSTPAVLELRFSGGRIGDEMQSIDGMPELAVGERYVVFTEAGDGLPLASPIVGFNQGLYRVVRQEGAGGVRVLVRDRGGQPLAGLPGAREALGATGASPPRVGEPQTVEPELDAFLAAVRAARRP